MVDLHGVDELLLTTYPSTASHAIGVNDADTISPDKFLTYQQNAFGHTTTEVTDMKQDYFDALGVFSEEVDLFKSGKYFDAESPFKDRIANESENAIEGLESEKFSTSSADQSDLFEPDDFLNHSLSSLASSTKEFKNNRKYHNSSDPSAQLNCRPLANSSETDNAILGLEKEIFIKTEPDTFDDISNLTCDSTSSESRFKSEKVERKRPEDQIVPNGHLSNRKKRRLSAAETDTNPIPTGDVLVKTEDVEIPDCSMDSNGDNETLEGLSLYSDSEGESSLSDLLIPPPRSVFVNYTFQTKNSLPSFQEAFTPVLENMKKKDRESQPHNQYEANSPKAIDKGNMVGFDQCRTYNEGMDRSLKSNISAAFAKFSGRLSTPSSTTSVPLQTEDQNEEHSMISSTLSQILESHTRHSVKTESDIQCDTVNKQPKLLLTLESLKGAIPEVEFSRMQREHSRNIAMKDAVMYPRDTQARDKTPLDQFQLSNNIDRLLKLENHREPERSIRPDGDQQALQMNLFQRMNKGRLATEQVLNFDSTPTGTFNGHELLSTSPVYGRSIENGQNSMVSNTSENDLINSVIQATTNPLMQPRTPRTGRVNQSQRPMETNYGFDSQYLISLGDIGKDWSKGQPNPPVVDSPLKLSFNDLNMPYPFEDSLLCNNFNNFAPTSDHSHPTLALSDNIFSLSDLNNAATFDFIS